MPDLHAGLMLTEAQMKKKRFAIGIAIVGFLFLLCVAAFLVWTLSLRAVKEQALLQACGNGSINAVEYLVDDGVSPDARDGWNTSCMFMAAGNGHIEVVDFLLERGIDIDEPYRMNKTALIVASQAGKLEIVRLLIARGADTNLRDTDGKTALDHAIEQKHSGVAEILRRAERPPTSK
ncbi:MAG: ankyrin repeat domain-containing protein [Acidobacteriota bacterium]|nr:ankyrin repeat domain-containing protein [Acidobacteriota bacterium]